MQVQGNKSNRAQSNAAPTSSIDLVKMTPQLCPNRFPNPGWGGGLRLGYPQSSTASVDRGE